MVSLPLGDRGKARWKESSPQDERKIFGIYSVYNLPTELQYILIVSKGRNVLSENIIKVWGKFFKF